MRMAYADPPYPGEAKKHYKNDPSKLCEEVDHRKLINSLMRNYYDGWALSTKSPALKKILKMCPNEVRVMPWVKPFASLKPGVNPGYKWEPVIVYGGRKRERYEDTIPDYCICNITTETGTHGAKPEPFCTWILDVLNVKPGDTFHDLFPGSGAVTRAYLKYNAQTKLAVEG